MRLGDVIRCLPIARYFSANGWAVEIETMPEYHGVQALVSYAKLVLPRADAAHVERTLDLQIWPARSEAFEASGKTWQEYVYTLFPEGADIVPTNIEFDLLPPLKHASEIVNEALCFPIGYSQRFALHPGVVFNVAHQLFQNVGVVALGPGYYMERSIFDYARRVQRARFLLTINSSASIVASATRASWHHITSRHANEEWIDPRQIRVEIGDRA